MFKILSILVLLIIGCSTAPQIIEKPDPVFIPVLRDSVMLRDSVIYKDSLVVDSLWYGEVTDSLGQVIGDLKVYYKKKIAEIKLKARTDTLIVKDTIKAEPKTNIIQEISGLLPFWAEAILMGAALSLLALVNKGKIKSLLKI